jgi:hypothetical protein
MSNLLTSFAHIASYVRYPVTHEPASPAWCSYNAELLLVSLAS